MADPKTGLLTVSVYRRPLPSTNLNFLNTIMWDGRETGSSLATGATFLANLQADLTHQAIDATTGHAQASSPPTDQQLAEIVQFELGLFTAQNSDRIAGKLDRHGASGGPSNLSEQPYYPGINDVLGKDPAGMAFNSSSMTMFSAWAKAPATADEADYDDGRRADARRDIAAGEQLFNTFPIAITNVRGLNDNGLPPSFQGTCTTCHDTPNVGNHSLPLPLDIGIGHTDSPGSGPDQQVAAGVGELDEPRLPVFFISGCLNPFPGQPESFYTTDPGKALVTGKCSDLNRLKGPILHGLSARAPYFHNGSAKTLLQAVNFYNERFQMKLTPVQKEQLVAFLNSL